VTLVFSALFEFIAAMLSVLISGFVTVAQ